jgi:hypothetical protein
MPELRIRIPIEVFKLADSLAGFFDEPAKAPAKI